MRLSPDAWTKTLRKLGKRRGKTNLRKKSHRDCRLESLEARALMTGTPSVGAESEWEVARLTLKGAELLSAALDKVTVASNFSTEGGQWSVQFDSIGNTKLYGVGADGTRREPTSFLSKESLVVQGRDDVDDMLSLDFSTLPRLKSGELAVKNIVFHGGTNGYDTLRVSGGSFDSLTYTYTGKDSGVLEYDDLTVIFTGLEPVESFSFTNSTAIVDGTPDKDTIYVTDGPQIGTSYTLEVTSGENAFERLRFANANRLEIHALGSDDSIYLTYTRPATGLTSILADGGTTGIDTVVIQGNGSADAFSTTNGVTVTRTGFPVELVGVNNLVLDGLSNPISGGDSFTINPATVTNWTIAGPKFTNTSTSTWPVTTGLRHRNGNN